MKKFKYLILGILVTATIPVIASTILGRMEISWPDFDDPGGVGLVTEIQTSIESLSDNLPARISENSAIADSTTTTITHNFGLNNSSLGLILYDGIGDAKVFNDIGPSGFTIIDNPGDPKNKIDITTPVAGGPHTFTLLISWGGGSGSSGSIGGNLTFSAELFEDIAANSMVKVIDDGGTVKFQSISQTDLNQYSYQNEVVSSAIYSYDDRVDSAYSTVDNMWAVFEYENNTLKATLSLFSSDGVGQTLEDTLQVANSDGGGILENVCLSYDPIDDVFLGAYRDAANNLVALTFTVTGGTIVENASVNIGTTDSFEISCSLSYDSAADNHLLVFRNTGNTSSMLTVSVTGTVPSAGAIVAMDGGFSKEFKALYVPSHSQHLVLDVSGSDCRAHRVTVAGSVPTKSHTTTLSGTTCNTEKFIFDTVSDKAVAVFPGLDSLTKIATITLSAGAPVFGTALRIDPVLAYSNSSQFASVVKNEDTGQMFVSMQVAGAPDFTSITKFTISGSTITLGARHDFVTSSTSLAAGRTVYYPNHKKVFDLRFTIANNWVSRRVDNGLDLDTENAVGILGTGGLSGTTQVATLIGGVSSSFLGQTISGEAYLQLDGTVSSSKTFVDNSIFKVGSFLDATSLSLSEGKLEAPFQSGVKNYVLSEDLDQGDLVKVLVDGNITKIKKIIETEVKADNHDNLITSNTPVDVSVSYTGTPGDYLAIYRASSASHYLEARVVHYNSGTVTYGSPNVLTSYSSYYPCAVYNPKENNIGLLFSKGTTTGQYMVLTVSGDTVTIEDEENVADPNPDGSGSDTGCDYNPKLNTIIFAAVDNDGVDTAHLVSITTTNNALVVGQFLQINTLNSDYMDVVYSKIYDSVLLMYRENTITKYHLYKQLDVDSFKEIDSLSAGSQFINNSLEEDETGGGILQLSRGVSLGYGSYNTINISNDTISLGAFVFLTSATTTWTPVSIYNKQIGKLNITYTNSSGGRSTRTAEVSLSSATLGTENVRTNIYNPFSMTGKSKASGQQSVFCNASSPASSISCDFMGGNFIFEPDESIGFLNSDSGLTGSIGEVALFGKLSEAYSGTLGATGYIDEFTGRLTETENNYPIGKFLETNIFQLQRGL